MGTRKTDELPARLKSIGRRLERWRATRQGRTPIPDSLWSAAARAASMYGISRTAKALRLGYYSLKERVEEETTSGAGDAPVAGNEGPFLQLAMPTSAGSGECILDLEDVGGAKMRVHLKGTATPDLEALSRSFWGVWS